MNAGVGQPGPMAPIRGDIIRWTRLQRNMRMRQVQQLGGPTASYQSDVEKGVKRDVSQDMLERWLRVLDVSEPFVRGAYPRIHQEPWAPDVLPAGAVAAARALLLDPNWSQMGSQDRAQATLRALATSGGLTATILAYMLDVDVVIVLEWLAGERNIPKNQVEAIAKLTQLSEKEILEGVSLRQLWDAYGPTVVRAYRKGISPETLEHMVDESESVTAQRVAYRPVP